MRHPQPKAIEPGPEDVQVNFQVLLLPGFKLSTPRLPVWPTHLHKES